MDHLPSFTRANTIGIIALGSSGLQITVNGKLIYTKGGPDNNPTTHEIIGSIESLASMVVEAQRIPNAQVRIQVTAGIAEQIEAQLHQFGGRKAAG